MKQKLTIKQTLKQKNSFNQSFNQSLDILKYNNAELITYLNSLPFINKVKTDKDFEESYLNYDYSSPSLYNYLCDQLKYINESYNQDICDFLISNLDSNGYFKCSLNELISNQYPEETIKKNLTILRKLEPYGCFCFSLKQSLKLQCLLINSPISKQTVKLCGYLEAVANQDIEDLVKLTKLSQQEVIDSIKFLKSLNPKPAANFALSTEIIIPEFKIIVKDKKISIQLLNDDLNLIVNSDNTTVIKEERQFLKSVQHAIKKRNSTLLLIMNELCIIQKDFFLHNSDLVKCRLIDIANKCDLNQSTISRAIYNKSFEFNKQYYLVKDLFSNGGVSGYSGQFIKRRIKMMIDNENLLSPLSDQDICDTLKKENIIVSRRAISKYRNKLDIPNKAKRKR